MPDTIPTTGSAQNGRTIPIKLVNGDSTIILNCLDDFPLAPAMNAPSVEVQKFQGGDAVNVTADGGYQSSNYTCEYVKATYNSLDQARANVEPWTVTIGADGWSGTAMITVSEGPTLNAAGKKVPTMTVQCEWTNTKAPVVTP